MTQYAFSHVGIQVADLERSLRFYEGLLGLPKVQQRVNTNDYTRRIIGYPTAVLQMALLRLPFGAGFLEIIEYQEVDKTPVDTRTANPGTCHICFYVENLDEEYVRLLAAGVDSVSAPETVTNGPLAGARVVYLIDPDGIRVELLQTQMDLLGDLR